MTETLYPLKFTPIYKEKIWGGQKIRTVLGKDFGTLQNCGESWEISGVRGDISVVSEGNLKGKSLVQLINTYGKKLVGNSVYERFGNEFPLLVKFIDANDDLSIQVHPDDVLARKRHQSLGKTEMWYILQADEGAELISGFNRSLDKESYLSYFNSGKIMDILNSENANAGDVFYLPAGRVHTIGKGLLLAEVQQSSDVTYRIYDFDRIDKDGNQRELHTEEALDALDYNYYEEYKTSYTDTDNANVSLVKNNYFSTNLNTSSGKQLVDFSSIDSFVILIGLEGLSQLKIDDHETTLTAGETLLIPACFDRMELNADKHFKYLETYVPNA